MKQIKEKLPLLRRVLMHIEPMSDGRVANAIYIAPAQRLRNAADDLEQKERDYKEFEQLINDIEKDEPIS